MTKYIEKSIKNQFGTYSNFWKIINVDSLLSSDKLTLNVESWIDKTEYENNESSTGAVYLEIPSSSDDIYDTLTDYIYTEALKLPMFVGGVIKEV